ncbi:type II secretion system F family protein [Pacificibacter marinus]|uniref:Bacterial type II secretion system protein F domain protein n=1 Tax=Pacificibacter marinus TaxID=658057 RepID=A0A1Y5RHB3_9RHOB|nr:type II secretion system F family protein [Pacificibacter marinus]SEK19501.1 tight adherence protein C [Pacificibacter marinus]SLN17143.1 Bacterial type II secretion system protein F domain protein [Pacificibacter marinus]
MLDFFTAIFGEQLGPFGPLILMGVLGVVLILFAAPALLKKRDDPLDRLRAQVRGEAKANVSKETKTANLRQGNKTDKLEKYAGFLEPQDEEEYSAVHLKLIQAGYRSKNAVRMYHFAQFALGLGLLAFGVLLAVLKSGNADVTTQSMILTVLLPAGIGYMAPKYWITRRVETRREEITNGFPDALDLMLVCVEAGQSLDQSIIRVAREIRSGFPALADEFDIVSFEVKAGKDKINVLRDMAERAGVPDVTSFVTVLIQSQAFGTSIADALRIYASEMRDKRVMRAEEKANTLPTKMTLATMMLTVPPLLIILIGPSIYDISVLLSTSTF